MSQTDLCLEVLELRAQVVEFCGCQEDGVECLNHGGGKVQVHLLKENLRKTAKDGLCTQVH